MRLRKSSNPKLMLGSVSAIDGASAVVSGGRTPLVESEGSNEDDIVSRISESVNSPSIFSSRRTSPEENT
jgi:hypothetical protein